MIIIDGVQLSTYKDGKLHPEGVRLAKDNFQPNECDICDISFKDLPTHKIHLHHRNEDNTHNDRANWQFICFDCHMKEHKIGNTYNKGKRYPNMRKFDEATVVDICSLYETTNYSFQDIADIYKCDRKTVSRVIKEYDATLAQAVLKVQRSRSASENNRNKVIGRHCR